MKVLTASISEKGTINGKKGDQTGREVYERNYYDFGQTLFFRPSDPTDAKYIVAIARRIANNKLVGYGQSDRYSIYDVLKKNGWQSGKIKTACNTDCSMYVAVVVNCLYEKEICAPDTYTGNLEIRLYKSGIFSKGKISKYYKPQAGDIVLAPGKHVVIVSG